MGSGFSASRRKQQAQAARRNSNVERVQMLRDFLGLETELLSDPLPRSVLDLIIEYALEGNSAVQRYILCLSVVQKVALCFSAVSSLR